MVDPGNTSTAGSPEFDDDSVDATQVETLFMTALNAHNTYVEEHFTNIANQNPEDPLLQMQSQVLIQETDSLLEVLMRFWSFYVLIGKAAFFSPPIYGYPIDFVQETVAYKPQIVLHFLEPYANIEVNYSPVTARIGFRIVKTPLAEINQSVATGWANQIKTLFALERFSFQKGWLKVTYLDPMNGYDLRLLVSNQAEAIRVIEQVLQIQEDSFDETKITVHTSQATFPAVPGNQFIYGQERPIPRKRPVATVQFTKAELKIWGLPRDIILVDVTGRSRNPLVT